MNRRAKGRGDAERRDPVRRAARLRPQGPALDRRAEPRRPADKQRVTVQLSSVVVERLRNAVYWTPGLTLTSFIEGCVAETVQRMETERGMEFPQRESALRAGRPPK